MNKIKIYTSPLLKEESDLFEKFHNKDEFYILLTDSNYSEPIENIFNYTKSFVLCWSPINSILKKNEQYHFWKLLKEDVSKNNLKEFDYSEYEKYL